MNKNCSVCGIELVDGMCPECDANLISVIRGSSDFCSTEGSGDQPAERLQKLIELDELYPVCASFFSADPGDDGGSAEDGKQQYELLRNIDAQLLDLLSFPISVEQKTLADIDFFVHGTDGSAADSAEKVSEEKTADEEIPTEAAAESDSEKTPEVSSEESGASAQTDGNVSAESSAPASKTKEEKEDAESSVTADDGESEKNPAEDSEEISPGAPAVYDFDSICFDDGDFSLQSISDEFASVTVAGGGSEASPASSDSEALCRFCGAALPSPDYTGRCDTCGSRYRKGDIRYVAVGSVHEKRNAVAALLVLTVLLFFTMGTVNSGWQLSFDRTDTMPDRTISSADILAPIGADTITTTAPADPLTVPTVPAAPTTTVGIPAITAPTTSATVPTTSATVSTTTTVPTTSATEPFEPADEETAAPAVDLYGSTSAEYFDPDTDYSVGDTFLLGSYEQDNADTNREYIEWVILKVEDKRILAVSEYGLDCQPYHRNGNMVTWKNSDLREWLNGEFIEEAFSDDDLGHILRVTIDNSGNRFTGTKGGDDTKDKVFCLSLDEYIDLFETAADRLVVPTEYAVSKGAYLWKEQNCGYFWLRTPGRDLAYATYGTRTGKTAEYGTKVNSGTVSVRPAVYLSR